MRGTVRGCVVLAKNGMPVADATINVVRADGTQADIAPLTDDAGWFQLDALSPGSWLMSALGPAGEVGSARAHVFDNALSDVTIEVALSASERPSHRDYAAASRDRGGQPSRGTVRGSVVRAANGSPVADATITVLSDDGTQADIAPLTDSAGWFVLDALPVGRWLLRALGPGGDTGNATVHVFDKALSEVTIEVATTSRPARRNPAARRTNKMERDMPGSVHGRVERAASGAPVADATISVVRGAGSAPDIAPLTDAQGRFALDGLPAGEWLLAALGPEGETGEVTVHVSAGAVTNTVIKIST